jgi:flagellar biogenesis protein FliO
MAAAFAGQPGNGKQRKTLWLACLIGVVIVAGLLAPQLWPELVPLDSLTQPLKSASAGNATTNEAGIAPDYVPPAWPEALDPKAMLVRLGLATGGVLLLCLLTLWIARRWLQPRQPPAPANSAFQLVEIYHLGQRSNLQLLRVQGRHVLVGMDAVGLKSVLHLPESFDQAIVDAEETGVDFRQSAIGHRLSAKPGDEFFSGRKPKADSR